MWQQVKNLKQWPQASQSWAGKELIRRIKGFRGRFRLDFTDDYLNSLSVDRLRHILLAALINSRSGGKSSTPS